MFSNENKYFAAFQHKYIYSTTFSSTALPHTEVEREEHPKTAQDDFYVALHVMLSPLFLITLLLSFECKTEGHSYVSW